MKKLIALSIVLFAAFGSFAQTYVNGYTRSNGTFVEPHYRSSPNNTKFDNYSTLGNVNPYTGSIGTKTYSDYNNYGNSLPSYNTTYSIPSYNSSNSYSVPSYNTTNITYYKY